MNEGFWIPIIAILSSVALPIGFGLYLGLTAMRTRHQENMELIKQGIVPPPKSSSTPNKYRSLRNGFLCIGIGLGLIVGIVASYSLDIGPEYIWYIAAPILLFLGIAYVMFYWVTRNKDFDA